jgi:hypothetical protein
MFHPGDSHPQRVHLSASFPVFTSIADWWPLNRQGNCLKTFHIRWRTSPGLTTDQRRMTRIFIAFLAFGTAMNARPNVERAM